MLGFISFFFNIVRLEYIRMHDCWLMTMEVTSLHFLFQQTTRSRNSSRGSAGAQSSPARRCVSDVTYISFYLRTMPDSWRDYGFCFSRVPQSYSALQTRVTSSCFAVAIDLHSRSVEYVTCTHIPWCHNFDCLASIFRSIWVERSAQYSCKLYTNQWRLSHLSHCVSCSARTRTRIW